MDAADRFLSEGERLVAQIDKMNADEKAVPTAGDPVPNYFYVKACVTRAAIDRCRQATRQRDLGTTSADRLSQQAEKLARLSKDETGLQRLLLWARQAYLATLLKCSDSPKPESVMSARAILMCLDGVTPDQYAHAEWAAELASNDDNEQYDDIDE